MGREVLEHPVPLSKYCLCLVSLDWKRFHHRRQHLDADVAVWECDCCRHIHILLLLLSRVSLTGKPRLQRDCWKQTAEAHYAEQRVSFRLLLFPLH